MGYTRKFRECFLIDNSGNFTESVLLTEYINSFIKEEYDNYEPHAGVYYDLQTLEKALNFTLISEGWLRNEQTYGDSVTIRVRLHALIVGDNAKYFDVKEYVSLESYLSSMLITDGRKYQVVNVNLNDIDDDFAKVLTKIYSRLIFDFAKGLKNRGSIPFHIVLEEAHRYIQSDTDRFLFGYNIFERIAKEGRKYGVILGLISQRPVEISDTVISQCTNFLIFKINHPVDVEYIRKMVPNITDEIVEKQKSLQAGTCLGFGLGFKIPLIVKMEMPNPSPLSSNCDVVNIWSGSDNSISVTNPVGPSTNTVAVSDVSVVPEKSVSSISIEIPKIESNPTEEAQTPVLMVNGDEAPVMTNSTGASNNLNSILNIGEEEKFDDSFVIDSNSAVSPAAVSTDSNVSSLNNLSISTPSISSSSDVSSFDSATAIPEITSVELSDNGMTAINDVPKITNEVSDRKSTRLNSSHS